MSLFISYAHEDRAVVTPLVTLMRCTGVRVFLDMADIPIGENWKAAIERAIRACDRMIVMWSAAAARSEWVAREIAEAQAQTKSIVPVMIDETPLPEPLAEIQGCSDLLPMIEQFRDSIGRHHATPERLQQDAMAVARYHTLQAVMPPRTYATQNARLRKPPVSRPPRVHIDYGPAAPGGPYPGALDPESLKIAHSAKSLVEGFGATAAR